MSCSAAAVNTWLPIMSGSKYGDQAYCQPWCDEATGACEHLAAVGQPDLSRARFDNFGWSLLAIFQIITRCGRWLDDSSHWEEVHNVCVREIVSSISATAHADVKQLCRDYVDKD